MSDTSKTARDFIEHLVEKWGIGKTIAPWERETAAGQLYDFLNIDPPPAAQQHVHIWADQGPKIDIKTERNSRGYNWEIKVSGAKSTDEALAMLADTDAKLKAQFAPPEEKAAPAAEKPAGEEKKVEEK